RVALRVRALRLVVDRLDVHGEAARDIPPHGMHAFDVQTRALVSREARDESGRADDREQQRLEQRDRVVADGILPSGQEAEHHPGDQRPGGGDRLPLLLVVARLAAVLAVERQEDLARVLASLVHPGDIRQRGSGWQTATRSYVALVRDAC